MADKSGSKEPFVSKEDRPEVKLKPDTPLTELRVRDLAAILGAINTKNPFEAGKTPLKDFFDKDFPEQAQDFIKELKNEKLESEPIFDPNKLPIPDPRLEQLIQAVAGLASQVSQLANQVEE